jgi:hypothetical protein
MSEQLTNDQYLALRREIGRDATATELARGKGEFRRQPHLESTLAAPAVPPRTQARRPERPAREQGKHSRFVH